MIYLLTIFWIKKEMERIKGEVSCDVLSQVSRKGQ